MTIKFVEAVESADKKTKRLVFDIGSGLFAVVKTFDTESEGGRPRTLKIWDLSASSYEKTKSYWTTDQVVEVQAPEIAAAIQTMRELIGPIGTSLAS